jgi:hydrogenase nickel incorporation protein HypA/HybF
MIDLMRKIEEVAEAQGATRVSRVGVRLGPLTHFAVEHFREHFVDASRGTIAEGAEVDAILDDEITGAHARDVVLEAIEVELPESASVL